jgi:hypothetical protein
VRAPDDTTPGLSLGNAVTANTVKRKAGAVTVLPGLFRLTRHHVGLAAAYFEGIIAATMLCSKPPYTIG